MKTKKTCDKCGQPFETTIEAANILRDCGMMNECPTCIKKLIASVTINACARKLDASAAAILEVSRVATV